MRFFLFVCAALFLLTWARADIDPDLHEDGVLYFEDNLPSPILASVTTPTVVYLNRDFGTQLGLFLPGQKIEIVGLAPGGYLVKGNYRNNAITGWIQPGALPPGVDPALVERARTNQSRHDKVAKAIKARRVLRGMTPDEVHASLGTPDQTSSRTDDTGQALVWTYTTYAIVYQTAATPSGYGGAVVQTFPTKVPVGRVIITFTNGAVTAIEEHKTDPNSPIIQDGQ